ncbi:hypothetical protein BJF89_00995 [Corynebacterium sp. CNJ-954]|uniref:hypothetical protein n=1 Tax=Corynebacterium sp. CNJ-954 TaxID=1904962 RepID=UPI00095B6B71|nr:hypothetical protein [Corynebacterium sp. CNJ-954]OLT54840.1 hypothetical protein BJF89_00995 [Corynebacterium sp. CNJ-954]
MRIVLTRPALKRRDSSGRIHIHQHGDILNLDDTEAQRLLELSIAEPYAEQDDAPNTDAADNSTADDEDTDSPSDEDEDTSDSDSTSSRPSPAMNRKAWDDYARSVGVDPTKFKSKPELIAALP